MAEYHTPLEGNQAAAALPGAPAQTALHLCASYLARDPVLYLDLTEAVRRGEGWVVDSCSTGALVAYRNYEQDGHPTGFTLCAADLATARALLANLPEDTEFIVAHEEHCLPLIQERFPIAPFHPSLQMAYLEGKPLPLPDLGLSVRLLEEVHLPTALAHYPLGDEVYLRWLLERGELYGAFDGNTLLGFMGRHAEGSLGLLEVLPQYRRRGIATLLQSFMTNLELSRGHIPYGQVFLDNAPSLALQQSLGFRSSDSPLFWAVRN